jgi:ferredoxin-type protein NapH
MKPAVHSNKWSILAGLLVGGFALWWYWEPFAWLGFIMAAIGGTLTFFLLNTHSMESYRRTVFISLSVLVLLTLGVVITSLGLPSFLGWVELHQKEYYVVGQTLGTLSYPCTREIPQLLLRRAEYIPIVSLWQTNFPASLRAFLLLMVPYLGTVLVFGRGICGWMCPFGGVTEAMVTGKKERWQLGFLKKKETISGGFRFGGLKVWVKDLKYGLLAGVILSSVFFFPIVCAYCPVFWLSSMPLFWTIIGLLGVFAIALPFMTKRRWWCHICPLGATFGLLDKLSIFRVKIDKKKCIKCMDCVQECRMYALTPNAVTGSGMPDADCIRCGRCIETCPEEAVDLRWFGTIRRARGVFITLAVLAIMAWYLWFVVIIADKAGGLF